MGEVLPFRRPEPGQPGRRPRLSARAMGLNPRALGLNPRALAELSAEQLAERLHLAAELARTRAEGKLAAVPPPPRPAATPRGSLRRPLAMPGCSSCGGTGWAEVAGGVTECECREGVIL